jgi:hypothetical protein
MDGEGKDNRAKYRKKIEERERERVRISRVVELKNELKQV